MPKNSKAVPDAWDDDWESLADRAAKEPEPEPEPEQQVPVTREERLAKHKDAQRRLWEEAETPDEPKLFLPTTNPVPPLATPFKPAVKVLSRKPAPKMIAKRDPVTGIEKMTIQDYDEEDGEKKDNQPTPEEIRQRQQREREEKQRRYDEARAKIFGEPSPSSTGQSTPRSLTPPQQGASNNEGGGRQSNYRARGRGRGGRGGRGRVGNEFTHHQNEGARQDNNQSPRPTSSHHQTVTRELYDPSYSPKPGSRGGRDRDTNTPQSSRSITPREEEQAIRAPRGPDASGGRGFAGFNRHIPKEG